MTLESNSKIWSMKWWTIFVYPIRKHVKSEIKSILKYDNAEGMYHDLNPLSIVKCWYRNNRMKI